MQILDINYIKNIYISIQKIKNKEYTENEKDNCYKELYKLNKKQYYEKMSMNLIKRVKEGRRIKAKKFKSF